MNEDVRKYAKYCLEDAREHRPSGWGTISNLAKKLLAALEREETAIQRTKEACKEAVWNIMRTPVWSTIQLADAIDNAKIEP